ncbi:MAG: methyltransferase domain-containing protein [Candidatus Heimdallarchaeaceae archaeon]|jgi:predicted RNA-binding protein (TIGR00451 family)
MFPKIPIISKEIEAYITDLLGKNIASKYFDYIGTPMEDYTLHVYKDEKIIDEILQTLRRNKFQASIHPEYSNLIICSPNGPFKIDSKPDLKKMVVDTKASEMIYQGADVYVPGVKITNKVKQGDIVQVVNQHNIHVANAEVQMSHKEILENRKGLAAKNLQSPYVVPSVEQLNLENLPIYFQSFPAYLTSLNLEPKANERILDCCAAPGNKTIHLSEIAGDKAGIVAVDRSKNRLRKLSEKINKFGIKNIEIISGNIIELSKKWNIKFDRILLDPPCTALGLRPRLSINTTKENIESMSKYQKAIFHACNELIKPQGEVIYSTCTISREENEDVIEYANEKLNFETIEQKYIHSDYASVVEDSRYPVQRFIPGIHKTLGYFIAKMRKI